MFTSSWEHNHWIEKHSNDKRVGRNLSGPHQVSMSLYNMVHDTVLIPTAMNICWGKGCSQKGLDNIAEATGSGRVSSDQWNRVVRSKLRRQESSFCNINGLVSYQELWIGGKVPKVQRTRGVERWYCERRFQELRRIYGTRCFSVTYDGRQRLGR